MTTPTVGAVSASPAPVPPEPIRIVACYDGSSSYPPMLRGEAQARVGAILRSLIVPGFAGAIVHERWITHATRSSEARLATYEVPGVPAEPVSRSYPPEPVAPDMDDPAFLYDRDAREAASAEYEAAVQDWEGQKAAIDVAQQEAVTAMEGALVAATATVDNRDTQVAAAPIPPAEGSDIGGCPQKAGDVLRGGDGVKVLVIASDMAPNGQQDIAALDLAGVRVAVIGFYCELAVECQERANYWRGVFTAAGATAVEFFDPDQPSVDLLGAGGAR